MENCYRSFFYTKTKASQLVCLRMVCLAHLGVCVCLVSVCIENCCVMLWYKRFRQFANFLSLLKKMGKKERGVLATLWVFVWYLLADCA